MKWSIFILIIQIRCLFRLWDINFVVLLCETNFLWWNKNVTMKKKGLELIVNFYFICGDIERDIHLFGLFFHDFWILGLIGLKLLILDWNYFDTWLLSQLKDISKCVKFEFSSVKAERRETSVNKCLIFFLIHNCWTTFLLFDIWFLVFASCNFFDICFCFISFHVCFILFHFITFCYFLLYAS